MYGDKASMILAFGEAELIRLTDRDGQAGAIVDSVLEKALGDAAGIVDGYLAKRYTLPLTSLPAAVTTSAQAIAYYLLWPHAPEEVRNRYRDAIKQLQDIAAGTIQLDAEGVAPAQAAGGGVQYEAPARIYDRDSLKGF